METPEIDPDADAKLGNLRDFLRDVVAYSVLYIDKDKMSYINSSNRQF